MAHPVCAPAVSSSLSFPGIYVESTGQYVYTASESPEAYLGRMRKEPSGWGFIMHVGMITTIIGVGVSRLDDRPAIFEPVWRRPIACLRDLIHSVIGRRIDK